MATFDVLKNNSLTNRLRMLKHTPFNTGTWKKTRLKAALGPELAKATLLDDEKHKEHSKKLFGRFNRAWGHLPHDKINDQLRFLTLLHTVTDIDVDQTLVACEQLESNIRSALNRELKTVGLIGAVEIEVINLEALRMNKAQKDRDALRERGNKTGGHVPTALRKLQEAAEDLCRAKEAVKLSVVTQMAARQWPSSLFEDFDERKSVVLVHFHGLIHLGQTGCDAAHERVAKTLKRYWPDTYCVELKKTFEAQAPLEKFKAIADYLTKGGNDDLRYSTAFGSQTEEGYEAALWRLGYRGVEDDGPETTKPDENALTIGEVTVLGEAIHKLMVRTKCETGYILRMGTVGT
ncbi:MAG: hypothetical protein EPO08_13020 [Rhodospirillaceae bacterium]|nr:MAG: hypothetical protein EPO08_13020 [Rhodospirillaceae bacterium]